jgi:hypothetical protein
VAENAERGVIFNLKANVDAQAKTNVDAFFESIIGAQTKVASATSTVLATAEKSAEEIVKTWTAAFGEIKTASAQTHQDDSALQAFLAKSNEGYDAFVKAQADRLQTLADAESKQRDVSAMSIQELLDEQSAKTESTYDREKKIVAQALDEELQAMNRYHAALEALRNKASAQSEEITDEEIQDVKRLEKEAVAAIENRQKADDRFSKATESERRKQVADQIAGIRRIDAENERMASEAARRNERIGTSVGRVVSAFSEGSEALMRFANGFKYLGLVGETDLKKMTDALLTIQGTTQVFTGAIRLVRQAAEGYDAYRKVVLLTAEAHTALAAAKTVEAAAGSFSGRATAGAVGGAAGSAAGAVAGGAAGSTLGYLATAGAGAGVGVGIGLGAIGIETGGMAGLSVLGVAGAAIAGLAVDLYAFKELIQEWQTFDFGQGAKKGGFVETAGTSSFNPFFQIMKNFTAGDNFVTRGTGLRDDMGDTREAYIQKDALAKKLTEAEKMRESVLKRNAEDEKRIADLNREQTASAQTKAQAERDALSHKMAGMTIEERRTEILKQIADTEKNTSLTADQRAKQQVQLANQRLAVEREISAEQIRSAQQTLASAKDELATKEQQIKVAQDAAMSAQERFGLLGADEQQALIEARKQFQGGAQNVDVDQLRKLRGFSGAMDEQIASEARRRAQAAGFGAFQTEDLKRIQGLEAERAQIEVKVKAQAQVVAKLEVDSAAVAKEINKQIDVQYGIILKEMASQIGLSSAKIKELENNMQNRFTRIP